MCATLSKEGTSCAGHDREDRTRPSVLRPFDLRPRHSRRISGSKGSPPTNTRRIHDTDADTFVRHCWVHELGHQRAVCAQEKGPPLLPRCYQPRPNQAQQRPTRRRRSRPIARPLLCLGRPGGGRPPPRSTNLSANRRLPGSPHLGAPFPRPPATLGAPAKAAQLPLRQCNRAAGGRAARLDSAPARRERGHRVASSSRA